MEDKEEFELLVIKLLANSMSPEEEAHFFGQIELDEEKKQFFENYQSLWRLSDVKNTPDIDTAFELDILKNKIENYSAKVILISLPTRTKSVVLPDLKFFTLARSIRAISVAASIILVFLLVRNFSNSERKQISQPIVNEIVNVTNSVYRQVNESRKPRVIALSDGSEVILYEKSEIFYHKDFGLARNIILKGKARFTVAKDKSKPFVVIGGGLQTKAIGTEFTVTAFENLTTTLVQLHEGKLLINPGVGFEKLKKEYFLETGDKLLFNKKTFRVKVISKNRKQTTKKPVTANRDEPVLPKNKKSSWYMFNNQNLGEVFDHLGSLYNVSISYKKNDVQNRSFIGMFNKRDSLENILNQIGIVNDLKVKKKEKGFIIYK